MCNFVRPNGEKCKLAPSKTRCGKHPVAAVEENNNVSNIVEIEMPPQVSTPVVAEVVHTPASSVIKPVEVVVDVLSDVPEMKESEVVRVIADAAVYDEDQTSNSELNISDDEYDYDLEQEAYEFRMEQQGREEHEFELDQQRQREAAKVNPIQNWIDTQEYDQRLFDLFSTFKIDWFQDSSNLWNLAGFLNRIPNADHGLMAKTYLCILKSRTGKLFNAKLNMKLFNQWADPEYKYHPKYNETKLKQIAAGYDLKGHNEWKAKYEPTVSPNEKTKHTPVDNSQLDQLFEGTFQSRRIVNDLIAFLLPMGKTFNDFKNTLCDGSFAAKTELFYWAKEYVEISNQLRLDFDREYLKFEHLLKSIEFQSIELLRRFVSYFINEFYVFDIADSKQSTSDADQPRRIQW